MSSATKDFCSALAALVGLEQNIIFLTVHCFNSVVLGRLSLSMCLYTGTVNQRAEENFVSMLAYPYESYPRARHLDNLQTPFF
jgi:hypothetical protein